MRNKQEKWQVGALVALPLIALWFGVIVDIELPGLYMDAVNPDYLAIPMIHGNTHVPLWVLPGNLIGGRFSILSSLYYGNLHAFVGVPLYALLGHSLIALRIAHGLFASAILLVMIFVLRQFKVSKTVVWVTAMCLAVDPSFLFAFRTQSYITMTPVVFLLASVVMLERTIGTNEPKRMRWVSGALFGLAIYGYFVYSFYMPAMLIAVAVWPAGNADASASRRIRQWMAGVLIGLTGYWLGYALVMAATGGPGGFIHYFLDSQRELGAFSSTLGVTDRLVKAWEFINSITQIWWYSTNWDGHLHPMPGGVVKTWTLMVGPIALALLLEWRGASNRYVRLFAGLMLSFFIVSLVFGSRLGGHHYVSLIVIGYAAWALSIAAIMERVLGASARRAILWMCACCALFLFVHSSSMQEQAKAQMRANGGVGLFSDAVTRFGNEAATQHADAYHVLPDWGLMMPTIFLSGGTVEIARDNDFGHARAALCSGRAVRVAVIIGNRQARIGEWTRALGAGEPQIEDFRQRNGPVVFQVANYKLNKSDRAAVCGATI